MKKILYVTPLVAGFRDILEGELESKGLPSFMLPLEYIQKSNKYHVEIVLISNFSNSYNINVEWISKDNIIANINNDLTTNNLVFKIYRKVKSTIELIKVLLEVTKKNNYEIIYCHGKAAIIGNVISIIKKIPCAYRLYGTVSYYNDLNKFGKFMGALKNPIYSLIFKLPKKYLMITDDGSQGDKVYEIMKPRFTKYDFYFLLNGVDFESIETINLKPDLIELKERYIFHAGRVDPIKRQDRNIEILERIHKKGYKLHLCFAGHYNESDTYYKYLQKIINEKHLKDYVHFLGPIKRYQLKKLSYDAICTLLMGDVANNGNVFYEIYSTGGVVVGLDGEGLKQFIDNKKSGFLVSDNEEAEKVIIKLLDYNKNEINLLKINAQKSARQKLMSWKERIDFEVKLLLGK